MKEAILVSACLLGVPCRYDGRSKPCEAVKELEEKYKLIPICPEMAGGLKIPHPPAEQKDGRVVNAEGKDVTVAFQKGAVAVLHTAKKHACKLAVLKAKSPSCGKGQIYDGTFSGTLIPGDGITAKLLMENGIQVLTENEIKGD